MQDATGDRKQYPSFNKTHKHKTKKTPIVLDIETGKPAVTPWWNKKHDK